MDQGPEGEEPLPLPRWMHPVGQEHDHEASLRIGPDRRACEARMAERGGGEVPAAGASLRRLVPSQGPRASRDPGREEADRPLLEEPRTPVRPPVRHHPCELEEVPGRPEEPRMWGHTSHGPGVLVVDLAPHEPPFGHDLGGGYPGS